MKLELGLTLQELYSEISRRADTAGTKINVAECSRVGSILFQVLGELQQEQCLLLVAHGLAVAKTKAL